MMTALFDLLSHVFLFGGVEDLHVVRLCAISLRRLAVRGLWRLVQPSSAGRQRQPGLAMQAVPPLHSAASYGAGSYRPGYGAARMGSPMRAPQMMASPSR